MADPGYGPANGVWTNPLPQSTSGDQYIIFQSLTEWLGQQVVQCGTTSVTTDANGRATIPFPNPYPTKVLAVLAQNSGGTAGTFWDTATIITGVTSFDIIVRNSTGLANTVAIGVSWIAIGN